MFFRVSFDPPNAKDQPDHGIKYLRVGAVANTLCHGLGCIQLLGSDFLLMVGSIFGGQVLFRHTGNFLLGKIIL